MLEKLEQIIEDKQKEGNKNLSLFVCIDLIEFINNNIFEISEINKICKIYESDLVNGSYYCSIPKTKEFVNKYFYSICDFMESLKDFDNYSYESLSKLFFENIEQFHINLLQYVYLLTFEQITNIYFDSFEDLEEYLINIVMDLPYID